MREHDQPVLRPNQSFTSSAPSNRIHQLHLTHSIHILCNFFIRDFRGRNEKVDISVVGCIIIPLVMWGTCGFFWVQFK